MTTENEMKPVAPADAIDGGRCALDAGFGGWVRCADCIHFEELNPPAGNCPIFDKITVANRERNCTAFEPNTAVRQAPAGALSVPTGSVALQNAPENP